MKYLIDLECAIRFAVVTALLLFQCLQAVVESKDTSCNLDVDKYSPNSTFHRCLLDIKCDKELTEDQTLGEASLREVHQSVNYTMELLNKNLHFTCYPAHARRLFIAINAAQINLTSLSFPLSWSDIHEVNVSRNDLKKIESHSFGNITDISIMDLTLNQIEDIDEMAFVNHRGEAIAIRMLLLRHNNLKTFKAILSTERYLDFMDISYNKLEDLSWVEQSSFYYLTYLKADYNKISSLGAHFRLIKGLSTLSLVGNSIKHIAHNAFSYLPLRSIDVSINDVEVIQPIMFEGLHFLSFLNLSHNKIDAITEDYFKVSPLEVLDLSHNNIGQFSLWSGREMSPIGSILLFNNNLTEDEIQDVLTLPLKVHELYVGGNKFNCRNLMFKRARELVHRNMKKHPLDREIQVEIICRDADREEIFGVNPKDNAGLSRLMEYSIPDFPNNEDFRYLKDILVDDQTIVVEVKLHRHHEVEEQKLAIDITTTNVSRLSLVWVLCISFIIVLVVLIITVIFVVLRRNPDGLYVWRTLEV